MTYRIRARHINARLDLTSGLGDFLVVSSCRDAAGSRQKVKYEPQCGKDMFDGFEALGGREEL